LPSSAWRGKKANAENSACGTGGLAGANQGSGDVHRGVTSVGKSKRPLVSREGRGIKSPKSETKERDVVYKKRSKK